MEPLITTATGREIISRPKKFEWVALIALILAATALRFFRLDAQDIWGDEAFSIFLSGQPLAQIIAGGADTHPPLYPVLLFVWLRLVGDPSASSGAFATRALSALIGILIVPLIFILGKRIATARVAWFAAILATVSPLLIYYSQETRMYELVTVLALGSTILVLGIFPREVGSGGAEGQGREGASLSFAPVPIRYFVYFGITSLAMYTHYSAFYVWLAQNVFVAWLWVKSAVLLRHSSLRGAADQGQGVKRTVVESQPDAAQQGAQATKQSPTSNFQLPTSNFQFPISNWFLLQLTLITSYVPWIIVQSGFLSAISSARFDEWSARGVELIFGKTALAFSAGLTLE
ncbi:MAG: glycosyltransferase family 39 protein, partial [Chloroflexi bacterium]|nr:glycosyltransferase family 39 protein [Chloroflexota bacterium]